MEKQKEYCDRCKKLDINCGSMVRVFTQELRYVNNKKTLTDAWQDKEPLLNKAYVASKQNTIILCDECFIGFMRYRAGSSPTN